MLHSSLIMSLVNLCVFMCSCSKLTNQCTPLCWARALFCCLHVLSETYYFPTYEVLVTSSLHSFLLKITVNCGLWMLMLSLINFIGSASCERCCSLRPAHLKCSDWLRRVVTPIPSQYWSTSHPSWDPWFIWMCIQSQWATGFQNNNNNKKQCVNVP